VTDYSLLNFCPLILQIVAENVFSVFGSWRSPHRKVSRMAASINKIIFIFDFHILLPVIVRYRVQCVRKWIRFRTSVRRVTYDEDKGMFLVAAHDMVNDMEYTEEFDFVVVANGNFSTPNAPYFSDFETFSGRLLHSHDLRNALVFKDKDVLIIGSSISVEDITSQCWKYGCKSVTISHRRATPISQKWPDNIKEVPLL